MALSFERRNSLLVGEGAVGKSNLSCPLMLDRGFDPDRSSTHGIEVKPLTLSPGSPERDA